MNSAFAGIHQWQSSCSIGIACHGQVADRGSVVIARGNFVEIFEVDDARKQQPLRRRFRIRLEGIPEDMKLCRFPGSKYNSILLSFRPARLSRLDFNPDTYEFETTAMLSFEDPKRKIGNLQDFQPALLAVDPLHRCAVMAVSDCTILAWPCKDRVQLGQVVVASDVSKSIMSAQPTTSANTVLIDLTEYGVKRIKSMAFLNGFLEPSLLILHEPELTWAGRTAVKPSTCVITAISINIDSCKHFLIANEKDIFYDTHTILPLAMPIGGALVISCNMVIHYKQKIEFALSLNEFGDQCTSLRVVPTPSKCTPMVLDRAVCATLSNDTVLIGACDGELYSLTLHTLGDAIRSMELAKITKTHIASTLCPIGSTLVFLGSKLGDSLLIEWNFTSKGSSNTPSRPSKRAKSDGATDGFDFILNKGASEQAAAIAVKMRDSLFSISPITKIQIGINNQVTPERSEIVACSGYERTGALVVIDDCVRPSVLASFDLKGTATGVWSAFVPTGSGFGSDASAPIYLIVSLESRTIVRKSENNELKTADNDGFALDVPTLYAGNVSSSLVQVTSDEVRILSGSEWKVFGFGIDTKIRFADILDSYIAVLTLDGDVHLGEITFNQGVPEVTFQAINFMSQCSGISLYKDKGLSGLFTKTVSKDQNDNVDEPETAEDLESLLFGSSATLAPKYNQDSSVSEQPVYVLAVALTNGSLQILSLPGRSTLFVANDCLSGTRLLTNDLGLLDESNRLSVVSACHLLLSTLCDDPSARPSLFISLDNGDLLIYNSFPVTNAPNGQIPLAFTRFHHGIITRPLSASGIESRPFAVPFSSVRGLSGIFIGGNRPQWLWGNRDFIHSTPQVAEGVVSAFCPFRGPTFAYCLDNTLRICSLPSDIFYDLQVTVRRIPVRLTPHLLTYHAESGTYALVTLKPAKIDLIEGETERTVPLYDKRCQMHLCTNSTMKVVDSFKDFEKDDEAILCVEDTPIASGEKKLHFLSVGTGNIESEEVSCRGRLLLFRVHDTTPSDKTGAGYRYNLAFESKEIGPVSAITAVQGFLCVCVGLRVIMYRWDTDRIVGCAFYDADFYSVSLQSAKGFILLADIYNSAHLLFWEPRLKQIMFLGKDPVKTEVYGADFLVDGEDLSLAICDGECNLRLIGYAPYQPDSLGGRRLLRRADVHIGTRISSFARIRGSDLPGVSFSVGSRYPLLGVGVDGSIICVSPVSDTVYRRLYSLTTLMTYQIRHVAGLNPRQFRTWHSTEHGSLHTINVARNIVDLDFLAGFASLDTQQQERMAVGIGTTPEQIVDDLLQLQLAGSLQVYVS